MTEKQNRQTIDILFPVPLLDLLGLGQGLQLGGGGCIPVVEIVPSSSEPATPAEASAAPVHRLRLSGRVDQLEGGLVLIVVVGVLGATRPVLALVLGHVAAILVGHPGPVRHLAQPV